MKDAKELLVEKGLESLEEIQSWLQSSKDFVTEQAPLLIQEIVRWGIFKSVLYISLSLVLFIIGILLVYRGYFSKKSHKDWETILPSGPSLEQGTRIIETVVGCVVTFVTFITMWVDIFSLVFVLTAPRLYVLQTLSDLLKK